MKKTLLFAALVLVLVSCKPEKEKEIDFFTLLEAPLRMDIKPGKQDRSKNSVGIEGDSATVHRLSRYMSNFMGVIREKPLPWGGTITYPTDRPFNDGNVPWFSRDTVRHTFDFSHSDVLNYNTDDNNEILPYTCALGLLVCMEDLVFCIMVNKETGELIDRMNDPYNTLPVRIEDDWKDQYYYDTLGYIPNSQMRANRAHLQMLLDNRQYTEMHEYFKSSYTIYTCTGEEYRELVRLGIN